VVAASETRRWPKTTQIAPAQIIKTNDPMYPMIEPPKTRMAISQMDERLTDWRAR